MYTLTRHSKRTLKKILKLKFCESHGPDLKSKLEILAVKFGIKPAFSLTAEPDSYPISFELAAKLLGLHFKATPRPPDYFPRKPDVKEVFLKAFNDTRLQKMRMYWLYREAEVESKILESVNGKLNEGYVLGYPECCIGLEEEISLRAVEAVFQDFEDYLKENLLKRQDFWGKTEEQIYEILWDDLAQDRLHFERERSVSKIMEEHIRETARRYPFAPHWACSSCLSGKSKETEKLNSMYEELATSLNLEFAQRIIRHVQRG